MFHRQVWLSFPGPLLCCFHRASCSFPLILCVTPCSNRDRQTHPDLSASLAPGTARLLQLRDQQEMVWRQVGWHNAPTQPLWKETPIKYIFSLALHIQSSSILYQAQMPQGQRLPGRQEHRTASSMGRNLVHGLSGVGHGGDLSCLWQKEINSSSLSVLSWSAN